MRDVKVMDEESTIFEHLEDLILLIAYLIVIFLKLLNIIDLSWFWVLSPVWVIGGLAIAALFFGGIASAIIAIIQHIKEKKYERNQNV